LIFSARCWCWFIDVAADVNRLILFSEFNFHLTIQSIAVFWRFLKKTGHTRPGDTREKLLQVAFDLIWNQSYGSVSVDHICARPRQ